MKKGIPDNQADILMMNWCYWGRSITAMGNCGVEQRGHKFGPHTPGFSLVDLGDIEAVENHLKNTPNCVGVMFEPIQGEGGIQTPPQGYVAAVRELCDKYNVLMICDEVQTGLGRTGKLLNQMYELEPMGR